MKKSLYLFAISAVPALTWFGVAQQKPGPTSVAVISTQRITNETAEGKAGLARVQALQRERSTDVRQKQTALEQTRSQLALAQADARARLEQQEQQQRTELERAAVRAQVDIQALQRQVGAEALAKLRTVVAEIVKERDVQLVLNSESAVIWSSPSLDLTDAAIAKMNAGGAQAPRP